MNEIIINILTSKKYELLSEGYNSKSYTIKINSKDYTLLQGRISDSYQCYQNSYKNLIFLYNNGNPLIKSLQVPFNGIKLLEPDNNNEFLENGGLIYEEIKGLILYEKYFDKINKEKIANKLYLFLDELYSIKISTTDMEKAKNKIIHEFQDDIKVIKEYFNNNKIDNNINKFEKEFLEYINNFNEFHYIHGDLWQENMIISEDYQDLVGIVDFDNFSIGDIAKDYAALVDLGQDFIDNLIEKNIKNIKNREDFIKRIKIYEKKIEIEDFSYILRNNNLKWRLNSKLERLKNLNLI